MYRQYCCTVGQSDGLVFSFNCMAYDVFPLARVATIKTGSPECNVYSLSRLQKGKSYWAELSPIDVGVAEIAF